MSVPLSYRRIDLHIQLGEPAAGSARKLVRAQCGDEQGAAGHPGELHGGDPPAACGLLERLVESTISPAAGTWSTWTNSTHLRCPTTAAPKADH